jgi:type I restriction enzyme M protein
MSGRGADKDLLGSAYEHCLHRFTEREGRRDGELRTPPCIARTLVEVLQPFRGRVYDPCCGSGGMFVQSADFAKSHSGNTGSVSFYGQDVNPTAREMAIMSLAIRGIEADLGGRSADTFHDDLHPTLGADYILADPPFNHSGWNGGQLDDDPRWKYGLPPSGNACFAWLQHMIHHLAPNGRMGAVLANGSLSSQSGGEGEIRRRIVEDGLVEGIVAMPAQLYCTTQIPVSLWFLGRGRKRRGETLFIDARRMGTMVGRRLREMTKEDIDKVAGAFRAFDKGTLKDEKGFCAAVPLEDIARQGFILTPSRYVGTEGQEDDREREPFDEKMAQLTGELSAMFKRSRELEGEVRERLGAIGYEI